MFTDLEMPHSDGFDLLCKIRNASAEDLRVLPVIVVTGTDDDEAARLKALELGATDFITKPFTSVDLLARARAHASYQRITQQLLAQVTTDSLTGFANALGFVTRLQQNIAYARRHLQPLTLVRLELDAVGAILLKHGRDTSRRKFCFWTRSSIRSNAVTLKRQPPRCRRSSIA